MRIGLDSLSTAEVVACFRQALQTKLGKTWVEAWLFFRLADYVVKDIIVYRHPDGKLQYAFPNDAIDTALHDLHQRSRASPTELKGGMIALVPDGTFEVELSYDDIFDEDTIKYDARLRAEYFSGSEILPAVFDDD